MQHTADTFGGAAPESVPIASRVMAWTPASGWTVQRVDPDEIKRRRCVVPTVATCTLAGDRHRKRPIEPAAAAATAAPPKRRRAMGPPGPLAALGKRASQPQARPPAARVSSSTTTTTITATTTASTAVTGAARKVAETATRKRALVMANTPTTTTVTNVSSLPRSLPEPVLPMGQRPFGQTPPRLWRRVRTLGCGTFGCVREVIHPKTGDRAAIKEMGLLPNDYRGSRDGALGDAFRPGISPPSIHMAFRELAAVAALAGHPSVVTVRDAYLAMPRTGAGAGVSSGIECALLMDLMDGHLGRVVRFLAGHGEARSRSSSVAPSSESAALSLLLSKQATASSTLSTASSSSSLTSSSSLVSSLFSSGGPFCAPLASQSPSSIPLAIASSSSSSSTSSSSLSSSPSLVSPSRGIEPVSSAAETQGTQRHWAAPAHPFSGASPAKSAACPFALRVRVARLVARDVLPALVFMHERLGMAHRDIKPNNILYSGDVASGTLRFRLADFGLARFVREPRRHSPRHKGKRRRRADSQKARPHAEPGDTNTPMSCNSCPLAEKPLAPATPTDPLAATGADTAQGVDPKRRRRHKNITADTITTDDADNRNNNDGTTTNGAGSRLGPCFTANVVTHLYKPPELLLHYATRRATEHGLAYGCAVDMWSFGVVLMEVLAGGHLTPSEPEDTLVKRVRAVFRLDGPPRPHLVRDLVHAMEARAAAGRSGVGSIPRVPPGAATDAKALRDNDNHDHDSTQEPCSLAPHEGAGHCCPSSRYRDLIDLVERLLCVDPLQRMTATQAMRHPFVTAVDGDDVGGVDGLDTVGPSSPPEPLPRFLGVCAYKALGAQSVRAGERARAGDSSVTTCTVAARKVAVARACAFADKYYLRPHTVACAVAMLDHYLDRATSCSDEALLLTSAGALLVACSLYECRWPAYDQFVSLGVVPPAWYGVDRRAPSLAVRTPAPDAVLRAAVDLFNVLDHLTPHIDSVAPLIDGSLAIGRDRKDMSPWRAMTATFSRYPPSLTLSR
nr:serine/threonine kinase [Pandoravirus massiliensis]